MTIPTITDSKKQFDRALGAFGLTCTESSDQKLKYENKVAALVVTLDNLRSFEVNIEIEEITSPPENNSYSLSEILRFRGHPEADFVSKLTATNQETLSNILPKLISLTLKEAPDFLSGNKDSFIKIQEWRNKECRYHEINSKLEHARSIANKAWASKNYNLIIKTLSPLKEYLSKAEIKKLEYSKEKIIKTKTRDS